MKTYSFVEYLWLYLEHKKMSEWLKIIELMLMVFVILNLVAWAGEGLLILAIVLILYWVARMLWSRLVPMFELGLLTVMKH